MRRTIGPLLLLLLAVLYAPTQAQALVFSLFRDFRPLTSSEPALLLLTGVALLTFASTGRPRSR
jgi:hypothetical protein